MLWHVFNRLDECRYLTDRVLAIPDNQDNDVLAQLAKLMNVQYFRGSENNVLARYYGAAVKFQADVIVRVTSDCPLLDPQVSDYAIKTFLESDYDYVYADTRSGLPRGCDTEVFSFQVLENAYLNASQEYEMEHVTPYIYQSGKFKIQSVEVPDNLKRTYRLCVDTEQDLELVREIYKRLYNGSVFHVGDIINLLDAHPELVKINAEVKQKVVC
jgi:spore coat polysaccharide biosynthesis protein SpsF